MTGHKSIRFAALASIVFLGSACNDDRKPVPTAPEVIAAPDTASARVAYLTISDSAPAPGSTVIVTAHATGTELLVGSFAAQLTFGPGLAYVGETDAIGGMRAINAKAGDVAIAGVNLEGFERGALFAVEIRVDNPAAIPSLALTMKELTTVDYRNERPSLSVQKFSSLASCASSPATTVQGSTSGDVSPNVRTSALPSVSRR